MSMSTTSLRRYFVYVLLCKDGSLYCGYTTDWRRRFAQHQRQRGATYTKPSNKHPLTLTAVWQFPTSSAALKSEYAFKRLSKEKKLELLHSGQSLHGGPRVKIE